MCDNFRDNEWKPLPKLNDDEKDILQMALSAAVSHYSRQELAAETDDNRGYYRNRRKEVNYLLAKIFGTAPTEPKPQKEKQLRPFKESKEFIECTGLDVGSQLYYRAVAYGPENLWTRKVVITELVDYRSNTSSVVLGNLTFGFEYITKNFIYSTDGMVWKPFGVYE